MNWLHTIARLLLLLLLRFRTLLLPISLPRLLPRLERRTLQGALARFFVHFEIAVKLRHLLVVEAPVLVAHRGEEVRVVRDDNDAAGKRFARVRHSFDRF